MPPKNKFSREEIVSAALEIVRREGSDALTARAVGASLGSSAKVIFGLFENMEELRNEVLKAAEAYYGNRIAAAMHAGRYPAYKASGMEYIHFAQEEKNLFRLLFMRDRSGEEIIENRALIRPILDAIQKSTGLNEDDAYRFHLEMWVCVHGIAAMLATSFLAWDEDFIGNTLTDLYVGLRYRFCKGEKDDERHSD